MKKLLRTLGVTSLMIFGISSGSVRASEVKKIEVVGEGDFDVPQVMSLLGIREGEVYSDANTEMGLVRLAESAKYQGVRSFFDPERGLLRLELQLSEALSNIEVNLASRQGDEIPAHLKADILEVIGISPGDSVHIDLVGEIKDRVTSRLRDRGYLSPKVVIALEQIDRSENRRLSISVEVGPRSRISHLKLTGFRVRDMKEFLSYLRDQDEIQQFLKSFEFPMEVFTSARKNIEKRSGIKLVGDPELESSKIPIDMPMDWISLTQAISKWSQKSRSRGYYDFQVKALPEGDSLAMTVGIELSRGLQYNIQIKGNVEFWEKDLRAQALDRTLRLGVPFSATDAEALFVRLYQNKGYSSVKVTSSVVDSEDRRLIRFDIVEGFQTFLGDFHLEGVSDPDSIELDQVLKEWRKTFESPIRRVYFDEKSFRAAVPDLLRRIRRKGFLQARILEFRPVPLKDSRYIDVEIAVQLGSKSFLHSVSVEGNTVLSNKELDEVVNLEIGKPVDPDRVLEIVQDLEKRYQLLGFVRAQASRDEKKTFKSNLESSDVDVVLAITPGPQVFLGNTFVQGARRTKDRVVERELTALDLAKGRTWNPENVQIAEQKLLGLGVFNSVRIEPVGGRILERPRFNETSVEKQERDLRVQVTERPNGSIEFGPGFRTDLGIVGFSELNYRNLGGWNRSVIVRAQASRKLEDYQFVEQRYSATYLEPYLANDPTRLRFNLSYNKDDQLIFQNHVAKGGWNLSEVSFGIGAEREIARNLRIAQNLYTISRPSVTNIIDPRDGPALQESKPIIGTIGSMLTYDSRDNIFNPSKGWLTTTSFELSSSVLGSSENASYLSVRQTAGTYFASVGQSILALSLSYSRIWALSGSTGLPRTKRLVLGGRSSIRSFGERGLFSLGSDLIAQQSFEGKIEYRQPMLLDLGIAYFFDFGQLDQLKYLSGSAPDSSGFRMGVGFGFRYATPVGPIALDFAVNPDRRSGEDAFKIQFSIGSF